jgi:hypothetical protein
MMQLATARMAIEVNDYPPPHANGDYPKHPPLATRVHVSSKLYSVWASYFLGFYISMYWLLLIREFLRS